MTTTDNDLSSAIGRLLEKSGAPAPKSITAQAKSQNSQDEKVSAAELEDGKAILRGEKQTHVEAEETDVDRVKSLLNGDKPKEKVVPKVLPKHIDVEARAKVSATPESSPQVDDIYINDVSRQLSEQAENLQSYFQSPSFMRMRQENPQAAQREIDNANMVGQQIAHKQQQLSNMASQMENHKLETNVLGVIPKWSDKNTQQTELKALISYYQAKGVSPQQLREKALNGQAKALYQQWKNSQSKPTTITTKRRGRRDSKAHQIHEALANIGI